MRTLLMVSMLTFTAIQAAGARAEQRPPVLYRLTYSSRGDTTVHVRIDLPRALTGPDAPGPAPAGRVLVIPRAIPMGYGDEPYDRFVSNVTAFNAAGKPLQVTRADGPKWRVGPAVRVEYDIDIARMEREILDGTDSSRSRPDYASFLGYSVFGFFEGEEAAPAELRIEAPAGWPVFSTLSPARGQLHAQDFYALADSQIAMGPALRVRLVHYAHESDAPLWFAYYAEAPIDAARVERLAGEAMAAMLDYFDGSGPAPFPHYTVLLEFLKPVTDKHDYGFGMEHLESFHSAMGVADFDPSKMDDRRLRYHIAHHVAHAWIPKRCYGEGYYPFTWAASPRIDTIWFSEGFAQYAAIAALATSEDQRQQMLDRRFRSVVREASPELRHMPLVDLSVLASTQYAVDFRTGQLTFARGGLMAAEIDTEIQSKTHGEKSLRDALRYLIAWTAQNHRAFRIDEIPVRFREATGVDIKAIQEKWLAPLE
jgi:predicted metalloprotease with PDZ domain